MITGVIEGFYGRAWHEDQRVTMLDWIGSAGMNTYIYAPKDDIHVRARWRQAYGAEQLEILTRLIASAKAHNIAFMAAIAPCLDITYSSVDDLNQLLRRIDQLWGIGARQFALLFDDIPNSLPEQDKAHFTSFAAAQSHIANAVLDHVRKLGGGTLLFCPTEYCARFANMDVPGSEYLNTLGQSLDPEIGVFWTGPEIVSATITAASLQEIGTVLRRKPVIWDNFHANDYDIRRVFAGPLGGRASDILPYISGFITNPNNELDANFVPIHTTGAFLAAAQYDEDQALAAAISDWHPRFELAFGPEGERLPDDELRLLIALFYQPFQCGAETIEMLGLAKALLSAPRPAITDEWHQGAERLRKFKERITSLFDHMTELKDRELFHTFHPYLWEAREEVTHLVTYLDWLAQAPATEEVFPSRDRIYNFYRQGFAVAIQEMLPRDEKGNYHHD